MSSIICSIEGVVHKGRQVGRTLGFPTANLSVHTKSNHLDYGGYGVIITWEGRKYYGVVNVVQCTLMKCITIIKKLV